MKNFKVTVHVMSPYYTTVEAETEEEAIKIALEREGPAEFAFHEDASVYEWVPDGLMEFPNLGKNELPDVEEE